MRILVPEIKKLLEANDVSTLQNLLAELEVPELADIIQSLPPENWLTVFDILPSKTAIQVIEILDTNDAIQLLSSLPEPEVIKILEKMAHDKRADLFVELPEEKAQHWLSLMSKESAKDIKMLIKYPIQTAGGIMTTQFAWIPDKATVGSAIEFLRQENKPYDFYLVYILNEKKKLLGEVSLKTLITSAPNIPVKKIMRKVPSVSLNMDQEKVATLIAKYNITSIPVVNNNKQLEGIITVDDIIDVIENEDTEDMHKFGGANPLGHDYIDTTVFGIAKARFPWLVILLVASFVSGYVIEFFSDVLQVMVSIVIFIPVLLNCSGNAGMQAASVVIRGLATGEIKFTDVWKVTRKEFLVGILMGVGLGILLALRTLPVSRTGTSSPLLFGLTVGLSMTAGIITATIVGTILPIIFQKLGKDPALMSGPLLTTIMDSASLLIYFNIAVALLSLR